MSAVWAHLCGKCRVGSVCAPLLPRASRQTRSVHGADRVAEASMGFLHRYLVIIVIMYIMYIISYPFSLSLSLCSGRARPPNGSSRSGTWIGRSLRKPRAKTTACWAQAFPPSSRHSVRQLVHLARRRERVCSIAVRACDRGGIFPPHTDPYLWGCQTAPARVCLLYTSPSPRDRG